MGYVPAPLQKLKGKWLLTKLGNQGIKSRESEEAEAEPWYPRLPRFDKDFVALEKEFNLLIRVKAS